MIKKICVALTMVLLIAILMTPVASAASGDVSGAIEGTWREAQGQIKSIVNNVVFPVIDVILAVWLFIKIGTAYYDYRKTGTFEWVGPVVLFASLVFTLTAPLYLWSIVGI